jgi:hypothetical protein
MVGEADMVVKRTLGPNGKSKLEITPRSFLSAEMRERAARSERES